MNTEYGKIGGIDVHKKWLFVVAGEERQRFGSTVGELEALREWLRREDIQSVVMESTVQYWRPVWAALTGYFQLFLAQAQSNRARPGRKMDFADATRLIRRLEAGELILSFVPEARQQEWRMLTRTRVEYTRQHNRVRNQMEILLEASRIKISGFLSDLLGLSGRRILKALAAGESDALRLAALADARVQASQQELAAALSGQMTSLQRLLLNQQLNTLELLERQIDELSQTLAQCLEEHGEAVRRLCEIPGIGLCAAEQIIAELGATAATFPTPCQLASWVGVCPGRQESAGVSRSNASPRGNRPLRRLLAQGAWGAVRTKDSFFQVLFRRLVPRLGIQKAIWALAHRLLHVIWIVLHRRADYHELGPAALQPESQQRRIRKMVRELSSFGYQILAPTQTAEA
jgi:transposase